MKTIYKSDDGVEFDSKEECEQYEKLFKRANFLAEENFFNGMMDSDLRNVLLSLHENKQIVIL
jgi:hypothetical protein